MSQANTRLPRPFMRRGGARRYGAVCFRPSLNDILTNMKTIAITIDEDTLTRLDHLLGRRREGGKRTSRSRVIREAVDEYVLRHERLVAEGREADILRRQRVRLMQQARAAVREQAEP